MTMTLGSGVAEIVEFLSCELPPSSGELLVLELGIFTGIGFPEMRSCWATEFGLFRCDFEDEDALMRLWSLRKSGLGMGGRLREMLKYPRLWAFVMEY